MCEADGVRGPPDGSRAMGIAGPTPGGDLWGIQQSAVPLNQQSEAWRLAFAELGTRYGYSTHYVARYLDKCICEEQP